MGLLKGNNAPYDTFLFRSAARPEIMRMRPDQVLLLRQGEHPLAVEKIRYYDQREFAGLFDPA